MNLDLPKHKKICYIYVIVDTSDPDIGTHIDCILLYNAFDSFSTIYFIDKSKIENITQLKSTIINNKIEKSRIIIWYTGHGKNISGIFPSFRIKNEQYISIENLYNDLKEYFELLICVTDCCNNIRPNMDEIKLEEKHEKNITI